MVWNYQNADCSFKKINLLCYLLVFGTLSFSVWGRLRQTTSCRRWLLPGRSIRLVAPRDARIASVPSPHRPAMLYTRYVPKEIRTQGRECPLRRIEHCQLVAVAVGLLNKSLLLECFQLGALVVCSLSLLTSCEDLFVVRLSLICLCFIKDWESWKYSPALFIANFPTDVVSWIPGNTRDSTRQQVHALSVHPFVCLSPDRWTSGRAPYRFTDLLRMLCGQCQ